MSALLLNDALLICVVTEVVSFSNVALRHISQGSVATHLRCGGIFNDCFCIHLHNFKLLNNNRRTFVISYYKCFSVVVQQFKVMEWDTICNILKKLGHLKYLIRLKIIS